MNCVSPYCLYNDECIERKQGKASQYNHTVVSYIILQGKQRHVSVSLVTYTRKLLILDKIIEQIINGLKTN